MRQASYVIALASLFALHSLQSTTSAQDLNKQATWDWPDVAIYEEQFLSYLDQRQADDATRKAVVETWGANNAVQRGPALIERILNTAARIDERVAELNLLLSDPHIVPTRPTEIEWLSSDVPGWLQDTIRLACGRNFAQRRMYDEALETLSGLELVQVCDPSSLIFYRATCEHHLMKAEDCTKNIGMLLERESEIETRFAQVANLMQADIAELKEDSLDEVSRLMRDVERRLDLGRAGKRVRDEEQEIVDKLEKLIEKAEQQLQEQQQQQQQQAQQNQQQQQSQRQAMDDSQAGPERGPGDVDRKGDGKASNWGNLPPAERQESLQRMTEKLPSHYRSVIEGYFRQLAKDRN